MKGSFLIKASDLFSKSSTFQGAVVLKIDGIESLERGVLFLTAKGFNLRFLYGQECITIWLGNSFNNSSLKYYEEGIEEVVEGIFCFNFDLGIYENGRENYYFTRSFYPANKLSFYYESSLAKRSKKGISKFAYDLVSFNRSNYYVFDIETVALCINSTNWVSTLVNKNQLEKGFAKIDQSLQVNTSKFINQEYEDTSSEI